MKNLFLASSFVLSTFAHAGVTFDYSQIIHRYESENRVGVSDVAKAYIQDWDPCVDPEQCEFIVHGFLNYIAAAPHEGHSPNSIHSSERKGDYGVLTQEEEKPNLIPRPPRKDRFRANSTPQKTVHSLGNSDYSVLNPIVTADEEPQESAHPKPEVSHSGCR